MECIATYVELFSNSNKYYLPIIIYLLKMYGHSEIYKKLAMLANLISSYFFFIIIYVADYMFILSTLTAWADNIRLSLQLQAVIA
jgi:hypothetical protein